ncbi:MAG: hypothetical protein OEY34_03805, partial [Cyclobacteriaceae bacterium]|nr:hypothetical protein [Cyclobacteriaceae bacterium]
LNTMDSTVNTTLLDNDLIFHWNVSLLVSFKAFSDYKNENPGKFLRDTVSNERFFLSFAHANRTLFQENNTFNTLKYSRIGINQILSNNEGFYSSFKMNPSNTMYLPDSSRFITPQLNY